MDGSLDSRLLFLVAELTFYALTVPGGQVVGDWQFAEEVADVGILCGICLKDRVVDVPTLLPPGVEDYLFVSMIRVKRRDTRCTGS